MANCRGVELKGEAFVASQHLNIHTAYSTSSGVIFIELSYSPSQRAHILRKQLRHFCAVTIVFSDYVTKLE